MLERRLDFGPIEKTLNELEHRKDLNEEEWDSSSIFVMKFLKRLGKHLHFDQAGCPPKGHASLEVFLSQLE